MGVFSFLLGLAVVFLLKIYPKNGSYFWFSLFSIITPRRSKQASILKTQSSSIPSVGPSLLLCDLDVTQSHGDSVVSISTGTLSRDIVRTPDINQIGSSLEKMLTHRLVCRYPLHHR